MKASWARSFASSWLLTIAIAEPVDVALVALDQTIEGLALAAPARFDRFPVVLAEARRRSVESRDGRGDDEG